MARADWHGSVRSTSSSRLKGYQLEFLIRVSEMDTGSSLLVVMNKELNRLHKQR